MFKAFMIFEQEQITILLYTGQEMYMRSVHANTVAVEKQ
jgi:hypothetical protein